VSSDKNKEAKVAEQAAAVEFDIGDTARWVGVPLAGNNMKEPVHVNDIRRWAQAMQNPNPLYYDEAYASQSRFGRIVAPQSFVVATSDSGGGAAPAIQGKIPGTHLLFGGDEWWFHGPRIFAGDRIRQDRMFFDYKLSQTKFAGPTLFSRGDTTYINDRGEIIAKQRATGIRYRADEALKRKQYEASGDPEWTDAALDELDEQKASWIRSFRQLGHERRLDAKVGDKFVRRPIGPHSVTSMAIEWSAYLVMVWGSFRSEGHGFTSTEGADWSGDAGWLPEFARDPEGAKIDPHRGDPVLNGPARGHLGARHARLIGMPRGYGFGASMGAWLLDYISNWAGEWGEIVYCKSSYLAPSFTGDVAFLDGEVIDISLTNPRGLGQPVATVKVTMANQQHKPMASAKAEVRLPTPTSPAG